MAAKHLMLELLFHMLLITEIRGRTIEFRVHRQYGDYIAQILSVTWI